MKGSQNHSNLLVTPEGALVFLGKGGYKVVGITEFQEKLFFKLRN